MLQAEILGIGKVVGRLVGTRLGLYAKVSKMEEHVALLTAQAAQDLAPKDTHALADNIRAERRREGWAVIADRGGDHPEVAVYLEFGTRNMEPRPFMRPALELVLASEGVGSIAREVGGLLVVR